MKAKVYVRHLKSEYQKERRTKFLPLSNEMTDEIKTLLLSGSDKINTNLGTKSKIFYVRRACCTSRVKFP